MKQISRLFILLGVSLLFTACGQDPTGVMVGAPAPQFTLQDRQSNAWNLAELRGQVVFVNFWATWCPPCREEMPSMQRLADSMPKDKFKMLAVLNRDSPANADLFIKKIGVTLPVLNDMGNNVGQMYGITGLPETFIIDKQGVLREKIIGPAQWDSPRFVQMIQKYIDEEE
jgi:peroxiredoxin